MAASLGFGNLNTACPRSHARDHCRRAILDSLGDTCRLIGNGKQSICMLSLFSRNNNNEQISNQNQ